MQPGALPEVPIFTPASHRPPPRGTMPWTTSLPGNVDFDSTVPYLGVGWGNVARGKRVGFLCDLGVIRQGAGKGNLSATSGLVDPGDRAAEAAKIEEDIEDYEFWPVISFGLSIRF